MKHLVCFLLIILFFGCGPTSIKLNTVIDNSAYSMFGKTPGREFYLPVSITDSVKERWEAETNGSFTNSSIAFSDSFVFINDLSGRITCFRNDNGKRVGQLKNSGTIFSTPVIHKFLVIYCDAYDSEDKSNLVIYDFSLGKKVNETEFRGRVLTQIIKTDEGVIFVTERGTAMKFNFLGHKLWENYTGVLVHSSPAAGQGKILFGNDAGELIALNEKTGELIYRRQTGSPIYGSPTVSGGSAFIGDNSGDLFCVDINTGDITWTYRSGADINANPVCDDSSVIAGNLRGDLFKLDKATGDLKWSVKLGGVIDAAPFLTINRVIVPELSGKIYFLDYNSGEMRKTLTYDTRVRLAPTIIGRYLYVGIDKGILKSYEIYY